MYTYTCICMCIYTNININKYIYIYIRGGEDTVDRDTAGSNRSIEKLSSERDQSDNSKSSNREIWARWGFPTAEPVEARVDRTRRMSIYISIYVYVYIYIYCTFIYIYIYIYMHVYIYNRISRSPENQRERLWLRRSEQAKYYPNRMNKHGNRLATMLFARFHSGRQHINIISIYTYIT